MRDPTGLAVVWAIALLILAFALGVSREIAGLVAIATALVGRQLLVVKHALDRRIRNVEDHAVLLPTLARSSRPLLFGSWSIEADFGRLLAEEAQHRRPE